MDKREWRQVMKRLRADRSPVDSSVHCGQLHAFLEAEVPAESRVVIYDAMAGEVDLAGLIAAHQDPTARYAITRTPSDGHVLTVHPYGVEMERHRYGYHQPVATAPTIADDQLGAVLVPGMGFDRTGGRLGHGMGFYDRFLARLNADALRIGITGDVIVSKLPTESFDVSMTHLATSRGVSAVPMPEALGDLVSDG